jgi:ribosomal protein S18 acetylase RimI-like enzyme
VTAPARAEVRLLAPADAEGMVRLRREALAREPEAFSASTEDDVAASLDFVRAALARSDQATFGAFAPELVGSVGVAREAKRKQAHRAQIWGLYVDAAQRGAGIGRALVAAALDFARRQDGVTHVGLCVAESSAAAIALYEQLGFRAWGVEPASLRVGGRAVAVRHMTLALR